MPVLFAGRINQNFRFSFLMKAFSEFEKLMAAQTGFRIETIRKVVDAVSEQDKSKDIIFACARLGIHPSYVLDAIKTNFRFSFLMEQTGLGL